MNMNNFIKSFLVFIAFILVIPTFGQNGTTKRIAILETVDKEGLVPYGVKLMVRSKLNDVITATSGYEGYDRVDIASIMGEHDFQRTGLVSDKDIKKLGEMTGADYVLVAEVALLNSSNIFLSAKILNIETAKVEQTANIQSSTTVEGLDQNCKVLAAKLLNLNIATGAQKGELMIGENKYVGEYLNGQPHGHGTIYYSDTDEHNRKSYDGTWVNGIRTGQGTMIWKDGEKYVGGWESGFRNGFGTDYYADGSIYEGNFLRDKRHGKGKITFSSNDSCNRKYYDGDWFNDIRQGNGVMFWNSGNWYKGSWVNGLRHGKGESNFANGNKFIGIFSEDERNGDGTFYWADGDYEVSHYKDGEKNGFTTYYWNNGKCYRKGYCENGKREGKWEVYQFGDHTFTETYKNGKQIKEKYHKH